RLRRKPEARRHPGRSDTEPRSAYPAFRDLCGPLCLCGRIGHDGRRGTMNSVGPDQAAGLRGLASTPQAVPRLNAIGVTGGKGGVGKSCLAVNLALALQAQGLRVLLIDFDLSLANADVLLGIQPTATVLEVTRGERRLDEVICTTPAGLAFV